jgi:hypothetical protein
MGFVVGVQICSSPDYPIFEQRLSRNHALDPALPARRQKLPTFRPARNRHYLLFNAIGPNSDVTGR